MKKNTLFKSFLIVTALAFTAASCSSDDSSGTNENLIEVATANGLTTFITAVDHAGLTATLTGSSEYTVFAPTNTAFNDFLLANGYASISAVPQETLKQIVLNHVLGGDLSTGNMNTGYKKTLAKGPASDNALSLFINTASGVKLNGVSTITTANIGASNGRLHIVDKVVPMPTVVTHLQANPEFSSLAAGFAFDPDSQFIATLSGTGSQYPFTVFAPTNDAFTAFLNELDYDGFADFPAADLETILSYHILAESNSPFASLTDGQTISTLAAQNFTITNTGGGKKITDTNARVSNFAATRDIQATNGIIHAIDKALLPDL